MPLIANAAHRRLARNFALAVLLLSAPIWVFAMFKTLGTFAAFVVAIDLNIVIQFVKNSCPTTPRASGSATSSQPSGDD